ncbi:MAG: ComEC/Rec2 family competence protein [Aurantibacter sp.]
MGYLLNDDKKSRSGFPGLSGSLGRIFFSAILLANFSCSKSDDLEILNIETFPNRQQDFSMWQLAQFDFEVQMGYIIKTDDGHVTVVDGGMPTSLQKVTGYIKQLGGHVHTWITTHPHLDHIGVLQEALFHREIQIDRILNSELNEDWVLQYEVDNQPLVSNYNNRTAASRIPVIDVKKGEVYSVGEGVDLKILGVKNDSITVNAINNSSLVFKIESRSKSVLFLGDLGVEGGDKLLKTVGREGLRADYVQMAHHGQNGVSLDFYKAVDADYALWPTPKWLWENKAPNQGPGSGKYQTPIVRAWTENELNIKKNYVAGLEGNIQID